MGKELVTKEFYKLAQDYHTIFTSNAGKEVLKDLEKENLLTTCRTNKIVACNDLNLMTLFNEGRRSIYLQIVNILDLIINDKLEIEEDASDAGK